MRTLKHHLIWGLLLAGLLLTAMQLAGLYRIQRENRWLEELANGHDIATDHLATAAPQVRLARAVYLRQKQRYAEALDTLSLLMELPDNQLQMHSHYNLGNLYLVQAMAEIEAGRIDQAMPLLNLAKQAYRQALTLDSRFWDAKYNLELAMHLLPEFDRISPEQANDDNAPAQLWTTVPGFPRGLP